MDQRSQRSQEIQQTFVSAILRASTSSQGLLKGVHYPTGLGKSYTAIEVLKGYCLNQLDPQKSEGHYVGVFIAPQIAQLDQANLFPGCGVDHYRYGAKSELSEPAVLGELIRDRTALIQLSKSIENASHHALWERYWILLDESILDLYDLIDLFRRCQNQLTGLQQQGASPEELAKKANELVEREREVQNGVLKVGDSIGKLSALEQWIIHDATFSILKKYLGLTYPFQIALHQPCIITLTIDKAFRKTKTFYINHKGVGSHTRNVAEMVSNVPDMRPNASQSPFITANVTFVVIIDEAEACFERILKHQTSDLVQSELVAQSIAAFAKNTRGVYFTEAELAQPGFRDSLARLAAFGQQRNPPDITTPRGRLSQTQQISYINNIQTVTGLQLQDATYIFQQMYEQKIPAAAVIQYSKLLFQTLDLLAIVQIPYQIFLRFLSIFDDALAMHIATDHIRNFAPHLSNIFTRHPLEMMSRDQLSEFKFLPRNIKRNCIEIEHSVPSNSFNLYDFVACYHVILDLLQNLDTNSFIRGNIFLELRSQPRKPLDNQSLVLRKFLDIPNLPELEPLNNAAQMLVDDEFLYRLQKVHVGFPIVDFHTESRPFYVAEINARASEVSFTLQGLESSPEETLLTMVGHGNYVFYMSATAGIRRNFFTSFNLSYLERRQADLRTFLLETHDPLMAQVSQKWVQVRQNTRNITPKLTNYAETQVSDRNIAAMLEQHLSILRQQTGKTLNEYKKAEINGLFHHIVGESDQKSRSVMYLVQTDKNIRAILQSMSMQPTQSLRLTRIDSGPRTVAWAVDLRGEKIRIVFYESKIDRKFVSEEFASYKDLFKINTDERIILISSIPSAYRGLSFFTTIEGQESDFEVIDCAIDPYFSPFSGGTKTPKEAYEKDFQQKFAQMRFAREEGIPITLSNFHNTIKCNQQFSNFMFESREIYIGILLLQLYGRGERRDKDGQQTELRMNRQSLAILTRFFEILECEQPEYLNFLSCNALAIKSFVNSNYQLIPSDSLRDAFVEEQHQAIESFVEHLEVMLDRIASKDKQFRKQWESLRVVDAFNNPNRYLQKLKADAKIPHDFIDSLYFPEQIVGRTGMQLYTISRDLGDDFCPIEIVLDYNGAVRTGKKLLPYLPLRRLGIPSSLASCPDHQIQDLLHRTGIDFENIFQHLIPRPHFLNNFLKGAVGEIFLKAYLDQTLTTVSDQIKIFDEAEFEKVPFLYEKGGDFFFAVKDTLFGFDAKQISRVTANRKFRETKVVQDFQSSKLPTIRKAAGILGLRQIKYLYVALSSHDGYDNNKLSNSDVDVDLYAMNIISYNDMQPTVSNFIRELILEVTSNV